MLVLCGLVLRHLARAMQEAQHFDPVRRRSVQHEVLLESDHRERPHAAQPGMPERSRPAELGMSRQGAQSELDCIEEAQRHVRSLAAEVNRGLFEVEQGLRVAADPRAQPPAFPVPAGPSATRPATRARSAVQSSSVQSTAGPEAMPSTSSSSRRA